MSHHYTSEFSLHLNEIETCMCFEKFNCRNISSEDRDFCEETVALEILMLFPILRNLSFLNEMTLSCGLKSL